MTNKDNKESFKKFINRTDIKEEDLFLDNPFQIEESKNKNNIIDNSIIDDYKKREEEEKTSNKLIKENISAKITKKERKESKIKANQIEKFHALDFWNRLFNKVSYNNKIPGQIIYHVLLGQALAPKKIYLPQGKFLDHRIHFLWIQNSGSGKGESFWLAHKVGKHLKVMIKKDDNSVSERKMLFYKSGSESDPALIDEPIIRKGKLVKNENGDPEIKTGLLSQKDIFYWEEAVKLLEPGAHNDNIRGILIDAMIAIGAINHGFNKNLKDWGVSIKTNSRTSIMAQTRPILNLKENMLWTGLPQRTIFFVKYLTTEQREVMTEKDNANCFVSGNTKKIVNNLDSEIKKVADKINEVAKFGMLHDVKAQEGKTKILHSFMHEKITMLWEDLKKTENELVKSIVESFIPRYKKIIIKLSYHSAYTRKSKVLELADVQYAWKLVKKIYTNLIKWVTEQVVESKDEIKKYGRKRDVVNVVLNFIKKNPNSKKRFIVTNTARLSDKTESYMYSVLKELEEKNKIKEKNKKINLV